MNDTDTVPPPNVHPAEERLLDAAMRQLLVAEPASPRRVGPPRRPFVARFASAALVLLACGVLVALWATTRASTSRTAGPRQDPAGSPADEVRARSDASVRAVGLKTENLAAWVSQPARVDLLERLTALRRLLVHPERGVLGGRHRAWSDAADDVLAPLAKLPLLEELALTSRLRLRPAHFASLRAAPKLRDLTIGGEHLVLDEDMVAALAALPHLRALRITDASVDAAVVARLRALPLVELELWSCRDFDAAAFEELCRFEALQALSLRGLGRPPLGKLDGPLRWAPEPEQWAALERLPRLARLELKSCAVRGEHLRALPASLTSLTILRPDMTPADFDALRRFGELRALEVDGHRHSFGFQELLRSTAPEADALAEALGTLRLTSLTYNGTATAALLRALAEQPDLERLVLAGGGFDELGALASSRSLRSLELKKLSGRTKLTPEGLRPLKECRSLRALVVRTLDGMDRAAVQAAVGARVSVETRAPSGPEVGGK